MCVRRKKCAAVVALAVIALLVTAIVPAAEGPAGYEAYADAGLFCTDEEVSASQGESSVVMSFTFTNNLGSDFTFSNAALTFNSMEGLTITGGNSGSTVTVPANGGTAEIVFYIKIASNADTGTRRGDLILSGGSQTYEKASGIRLEISENWSSETRKNQSLFSGNLSHSISPAGGFSSGDGNQITFNIYNNGTGTLKNAVIAVTLPEGMYIYNDSSSKSIGYISTGKTKSVTFPITVDDDLKSGNYAVTAKVTALGGDTSETSFERTFYVPVNGGGATVSSKNISITNINYPNAVEADEPFTFGFTVKNTGSSAVKDVKISAEMPEGMMNKTSNVFVENSIAAGGSKTYSMKLFSNKGDTAYPIKISVASLDDSEKEVAQYVSIYVEGGSGVKTPKLMVDHYDFGGDSVQAGSSCVLHIGIHNTSKKKISNIKVSLKSEGNVVPVGGSNSFFVDELAGGEHFSRSLMFSVKPAAEPGTEALTVSMTYENGSGEEFSAEDIIAIPVTQASRLVVDDITAPSECYVGEMASAEVEFYNMGKSTLSNVRVTASGNFDSYESTSYFAGNMESGSSDTYTLNFVPREEGPLEGVITFTYEDADSVEQIYEMPFVFEVMAAPEWDEEEFPEEEEGGKIPWKIIIPCAVIALLVAGFAVWRTIRRKKMHKALQIADEAFMDSLDLDSGSTADENSAESQKNGGEK
ncbi:MAG: hypothetical protein K6F52_04265 [Clostridia bacterium]|nr:hypothetical protein [Clostridia bacterium]